MMPEALRKEIVDTFPIGTPPSEPIKPGIYESVHDGVDEVRAAFLGKEWTQVNVSNPVDHGFLQHATGYLTFDAFTYYFPAFLCGFIEQAARDKSVLCFLFISQLNPQSASDETQNFFQSLTPQQAAVIADFLEHVWQHDSDIAAMLALENFWDVYLSADRRKAIAESDAAERIYKTFGWTQKA
jgi:hypothetical protein